VIQIGIVNHYRKYEADRHAAAHHLRFGNRLGRDTTPPD
jgi:hypothetical protein